MPFVLLGEFDIARARPLDGNIRIVIANPPLVLGMIEIIAFVDELCRVAKDDEAVSKTTRNHEHPFVIFRQEDADPLAIGPGVLS